MEELLFLVTKPSPDASIRAVGCVTRSAAHTMGFAHTSVLVIPATWDNSDGKPSIYLHKRSPFKRTSPNTWDFCGGHVTFKDSDCANLRNTNPEPTCILGKLASDTAIREANEEIRCDPPFQFKPEHSRRFKPVGYFECNNKTNRGHNVEYSTAFVVCVPSDREVHVWDIDAEGERELEVRRCYFDELLEEYRTDPNIFADGAGRILETLVAQPGLQQELARLMEELNEPY